MRAWKPAWRLVHLVGAQGALDMTALILAAHVEGVALPDANWIEATVLRMMDGIRAQEDASDE